MRDVTPEDIDIIIKDYEKKIKQLQDFREQLIKERGSFIGKKHCELIK